MDRKTIKIYDLDGVATRFPVTFEYLARKFVKVTLLGGPIKELTLVTEFVFENPSTIRTLSTWGPAQGYTQIEIRRVTSASDRIVDFVDATVLRASDLNTAELQSLHIAEEARDVIADSIGLDSAGNLDARFRRIVNLSDPINPQDAVNFQTMMRVAGDAPAAALAAREAAALAHDSTITANAAAARADALRSELNSQLGAAMVGIFTGTDPARTVQQQLDMLYSGIANITDTRYAGGAKADGSDSTAAIQAALDSGGTIYIPPGTFNITSLHMSRNNTMLHGCGYNQSILKMADTQTIGVRVGANASVSGVVLQDFKLQGNDNNLGGIQLGNSAYYCAIPMIDRVGVWGFGRATGTNGFGIQLVQVQNATIRNCWLYRNRHQIQRPNGGYCTSTRIEGKSGYIGEGFIGIYVDGQCDDIYLSDVVLEGNQNSAVYVTSSAVTEGRGTTLYISGAYFEMNNAVGLGVIYMIGGAGAYQSHVLVMDKVNFASNTGYRVNLDRTVATIGRCKLIPQQVLLTAHCTAHFEHNWFPNAGDYLAGYRALLGNVTATDFTPASAATDPNQVNMLNGIQFPAVPRLVKDQYTLDDYREFVEGQWVPTPSGITGTITTLRGQYVKIGRQFTVNIILAVTNLSNTFGNGGIFLPFPPQDSSSGSMFITSSGTPSGVYVDAATGAVLLPDLPAGNYTMMITVTCFAKE